MFQKFINKELTEFIWSSEVDHTEISSVTLPFLGHELIFNFGDLFSINNSESKFLTFISGLSANPMKTQVKGYYHTLGLMLHPTTFYRRFGVPATELSDSASDLKDILGKEIGILTDKIIDENSPEIRIALVEKFFAKKNFKKEVPMPVLRFIKDIQIEYLRKGNLNAMAINAGISSKHLIHLFKEVFGVNPHKYLQLIHFNNALHSLYLNKGLKLSSVAYRTGFFDQSHFTRIFKKYSGITPKQYKKAIQENRVSKNFPNTIIN